ncbi:EamA family transporter [Georgenia alba]|uniref:DMT family transporter n=1 Tax=Georgenia alba TaxID=2233858 RepID=A0ABW2QEH1_9MICO
MTAGGEPSVRRQVPAEALFMGAGLSQHLGSAVAVGLFAHLPATTVAWWRLPVSAVVLLVWRKPWRVRWTGRMLAASSLFGTILGGMNLLFYTAIDHLALGTAISLEYLGPVAVAVTGARTARTRLAVVPALLGVVSISGIGLDWSRPGTGTGVLFAVLSGAAWAAYIVLGRRIATNRDGLTSLAVGSTVGSVVLLPLVAPTAALAFASPGILLGVLAVGVLSSLVPYAVDQVALTRLSAGRFALLTALLPATSLVVGLVLLAQVPSVGEAVGLALISVAVLLANREGTTRGRAEGA